MVVELTVFNFSVALEQLKNGKRVRRAGWNGKGMWLLLVTAESWEVPEMAAHDYRGGMFDCTRTGPFIGMRTADNKFVPWLASQTDILADDWEEA